MRKHPILWIIKQIRGRIPAILLMCVAQVMQALFGVWFAMHTRNVIDCAVDGRKEAFMEACLNLAAVILGILLCLLIFRHLRDKLHADLERDWKQDLLHGLLQGDYAEISQFHSAELLNRLNNDVRTVNEGVLNLLPNLLSMVVRFVAVVSVLAILDARFTLLMLLLGLLLLVITGKMREKLKVLHKLVSEHDGKVSGLLQESMEKLLMIQAMDVSAQVERRAGDLLEKRYEIQRKRKNFSLAANMGVSVMSYGTNLLALIWCAYALLQGSMTVGSLTAVTQLVSQLRSPLVGLSGVIPQYTAMVASAERLQELDGIGRELPSRQESVETLYQNLTFLGAEHLCFSYDREQILNDASFALPKGTFTIITGISGIGKSTLLKLMLGIYRPEKGRMFAECDGEKLPLDRSTRNLFAYVPQGNLLMSGTLRDNLTIVSPDATQEEIDEAVYVSAMDEFLPLLPQGLDTPMGENGAGLSEGQAQRLAIARAVLGGAPILLLDECTSALDMETEQTVLQRLKALPGRTCIAVTHRPAALSICDYRLEVEQGCVRCVEKPKMESDQ